MIDGKRIPVIVCLCGKRLDAATEIFRRAVRPKVGDITLCGLCGRAYLFAASNSLQELTSAEVAALPVGLLSQVTNAQRRVLKDCTPKGEA